MIAIAASASGRRLPPAPARIIIWRQEHHKNRNRDLSRMNKRNLEPGRLFVHSLFPAFETSLTEAAFFHRFLRFSEISLAFKSIQCHRCHKPRHFVTIMLSVRQSVNQLAVAVAAAGVAAVAVQNCSIMPGSI